MSAFPVGSNVVHCRRYGNARNLRQMSEPTGVATKSTSKSRSKTRSISPAAVKLNHNSSAESSVRKAAAFNSPMQHSLKLGRHMGELTSATFINMPKQQPLALRSISVDAIFRNILSPNVTGMACSKPLPINIQRDTDKENFGLAANKNDSGFGSALNMSSLSGLGLATTGFMKTGANSVSSLQCVLDALQNIASHRNQN